MMSSDVDMELVAASDFSDVEPVDEMSDEVLSASESVASTVIFSDLEDAEFEESTEQIQGLNTGVGTVAFNWFRMSGVIEYEFNDDGFYNDEYLPEGNYNPSLRAINLGLQFYKGAKPTGHFQNDVWGFKSIGRYDDDAEAIISDNLRKLKASLLEASERLILLEALERSRLLKGEELSPYTGHCASKPSTVKATSSSSGNCGSNKKRKRDNSMEAHLPSSPTITTVYSNSSSSSSTSSASSHSKSEQNSVASGRGRRRDARSPSRLL